MMTYSWMPLLLIESYAVDVASTSTNYRLSFLNDESSSITTDASSGVTKCSSVTSVATDKLKQKLSR